MRVLQGLVLAAVVTVGAVSGSAQGVPPPDESSHWGFDQLTNAPATQSSFTFDRTMLSMADAYFGQASPDAQRVLAGLNTITVHNYHYRDDVYWDPGSFSMVDSAFTGMGWKHLVNGNSKDGNHTDMWLHYEGATVRNVVVLTRGYRNMNYVAVDCTLRPLDLLHLSGHFGIPKVDESAVMVPATPPPAQSAPAGPAPELKRR